MNLNQMSVRDSTFIKNFKKPVLIALLLAAGSLLFKYYIDSPTHPETRSGEFVEAIIPDLIATIVIAILVTIFWDGLTNYEKQKEKREFLDDIAIELKNFWETTAETKFKNELMIGVQNIAKGLTMGDASDIFEMASWYIKDCYEIRVIGTVKMNHLNGFESLGVEKCVLATEDRIGVEPALSYRRITALNLNDKFKKHLQKCFDLKGQNKNLELIFLADFSPAYTYLIIDRRFLMVSLTYGESDIQRYCLYTESNDYKLIDEFITHFESIWTEEKDTKGNRPIKERAEFDHIHTIQSEAESHFKLLKKRINDFPHISTLFQQHALKELGKFASNFKYDGNIPIPHTSDNENLIRTFIIYLCFLKAGDEYKTITFLNFWTKLISTKELLEDFLSANELALTRKVGVERLLVVSQKCIENDTETYCKEIREIIKKNVVLMKKQPLYKFRILFSLEHDELEKEKYNLAVITSKQTNEKIIFKPIRKEHEIHSDISVDSNRVRADENKYFSLTELWEKQSLSIKDKEFIKRLNLEPEIITRLLHKRI